MNPDPQAYTRKLQAELRTLRDVVALATDLDLSHRQALEAYRGQVEKFLADLLAQVTVDHPKVEALVVKSGLLSRHE